MYLESFEAKCLNSVKTSSVYLSGFKPNNGNFKLTEGILKTKLMSINFITNLICNMQPTKVF